MLCYLVGKGLHWNVGVLGLNPDGATNWPCDPEQIT